jgi:hypothetical protein
VTARRTVAGAQIRYRECLTCRCRFKTRETVVSVTRRPASPKPID